MENFIAVMAANCDPALETCSNAASEQLARPDAGGFSSLMLGYVLSPIA